MVVAILLGGGVLLIILLDPPHTVCDTQAAVFKTKQKTFLFEGEKKVLGKKTASDYDKLLKICVMQNSSGGCSEWAFRVRELLRDLKLSTERCAPEIAATSRVKKVIWESLEVLTRGAWGVGGPKSEYDKLGWLTPSDVNLYCELKVFAQANYPKSDWEKFREKMLKALPESSNLNRDQAWSRMLLSTRCEGYL